MHTSLIKNFFNLFSSLKSFKTEQQRPILEGKETLAQTDPYSSVLFLWISESKLINRLSPWWSVCSVPETGQKLAKLRATEPGAHRRKTQRMRKNPELKTKADDTIKPLDFLHFCTSHICQEVVFNTTTQ